MARQSRTVGLSPTGIIEQLRQRPYHRPDYFLGLMVLALIAVGMIVIYSTGSIANFNITGGTSDRNSFFYSQLGNLAIGLAGWFFASRIKYDTWKVWAPWMLGISLFLMLLVLVPGLSTHVNGASRWVRLGFLSFQPAEFLKLSLVLWLATWLDANRTKLRSIKQGLLPVMLVLTITAILSIVIQRDMGTGLVLLGAGLAVFFVSDAPIWIFGIGMGGFLAGAGLLVALFPYRLARLASFFNHTDDVTGADYHINQALIAMGSGGILGRGLGNSLQSYGYLPESTNDSIFAIVGEQFGLWGTLLVVGLFSSLAWRGLRICRQAPDRLSRMIATGIITWLTIQALINMMAMLSLIPLTGIPLPFISYGGTSLIASLVAVGILQNISRYTEREAANEDRSIRRRNRRTSDASASAVSSSPLPDQIS